jgi:hypothetical protein
LDEFGYSLVPQRARNHGDNYGLWARTDSGPYVSELGSVAAIPAELVSVHPGTANQNSLIGCHDAAAYKQVQVVQVLKPNPIRTPEGCAVSGDNDGPDELQEARRIAAEHGARTGHRTEHRADTSPTRRKCAQDIGFDRDIMYD